MNPPQLQPPYNLIIHPPEIFATTAYTLTAETHSVLE